MGEKYQQIESPKWESNKNKYVWKATDYDWERESNKNKDKQFCS